MRPGGWQQAALIALADLLAADEAVRGLALIGSCARAAAELDEWSDVDLVLVVNEAAVGRFFPATDWLRPLGETHASAACRNRPFASLRVYFTDGRRVDLAIAAEQDLQAAAESGLGPLLRGARVLFSRSPALDSALQRPARREQFRPASAGQFERLADDIWFKGMLAGSKVARNDLLVALHLSLDMVRDCCVLGMMLRDRQAGTDHHRDGSAGHPFVARLGETQQPYTAPGILERVRQSAIAFDALAAEWNDTYRERRGPLLAWLERVGTALVPGAARA